jgi:hypothetical protein
MAYQCRNKERKICLEKDPAKALSDITKIVFDFDGVVVQTSQSYRQTIRKVVDHCFLEILGLEGACMHMFISASIQALLPV